jgi:hypothetical protein
MLGERWGTTPRATEETNSNCFRRKKNTPALLARAIATCPCQNASNIKKGAGRHSGGQQLLVHLNIEEEAGRREADTWSIFAEALRRVEPNYGSQRRSKGAQLPKYASCAAGASIHVQEQRCKSKVRSLLACRCVQATTRVPARNGAAFGASGCEQGSSHISRTLAAPRMLTRPVGSSSTARGAPTQ